MSFFACCAVDAHLAIRQGHRQTGSEHDRIVALRRRAAARTARVKRPVAHRQEPYLLASRACFAPRALAVPSALIDSRWDAVQLGSTASAAECEAAWDLHQEPAYAEPLHS